MNLKKLLLLFCLGCAPLLRAQLPADSLRNFFLNEDSRIRAAELTVSNTLDLFLDYAYRVYITDTTLHNQYKTCMAIGQKTHNLYHAVNELQSLLIRTADGIPAFQADTTCLRFVQHPFEVAKLRNVLFGEIPADSLDCAARRFRNAILDNEQLLLSVDAESSYFQLMKISDNPKPGLSWEHQAFDGNPLIADILFLDTLSLRVLIADNQVLGLLYQKMLATQPLSVKGKKKH